MREYAVVPSRRFEDDFSDLPRDIQRQIVSAVARTKANPHRGQKLHGVPVGEWRYRVGDYRIRYDIDGFTVYLHLVRHRKDVYR